MYNCFEKYQMYVAIPYFLNGKDAIFRYQMHLLVMKKGYCFLFLLVVSAVVKSCIYDFNPQVDGEGGYMIVDGDIIIGEVSKIRLSYSWSLVDTSATQDEERMRILYQSKMHVEDSQGGRYNNLSQGGRSAIGYFDMRDADPSLEYRLVIENANGTYVSSWGQAISPGYIDSLSFRINSKYDVLGILVSAHSSDPTPSYYRWTVEETWEYHAQVRAYYKYLYTGGPDGEVVPMPDSESTYRCWLSDSRPEIMTASSENLKEDRLVNHEIYTIGNLDQRISVCYQPEVTQMRISEEAYRYWEQMERNGRDVGGLYSPEPTEMRGNVSNVNDPYELVLGYVDVVRVTHATFYVKNILFYKWPERETGLGVILNNGDSYLEAYRYWRLPVTDVWHEQTGSWIGYEWWPYDCVDCRLQGGTTKRPPEWPI